MIAALLAAATLSVGHARHEIAAKVGPGTTITACRRLDARAVRCTFRTPGVNLGIEDPEHEAVFTDHATARLTRHGITVNGPGI